MLEIDGQAPITVSPGGSWTMEAGKAHNARSKNESAAKIIAIYVVEQGKPLAAAMP